MTEATLHPRYVPENVLTWSTGAPGVNGVVTVHAFATPADAGSYIADIIAQTLSHAVDQRGQALWLGCGGSTPKPVYKHLAYAELDWSSIKLVQVDERFVPVDDTQSNTRMMSEALAPVLGAGKMELVSLIQNISDQNACAALAEAKLLDLGGGEAPMFDIALMGMGPDAHYASIFPNHPLNDYVYDTKALVLPVKAKHDGSEPVLPRITLSVSQINRCRRVLFYITGEAKLEVLKTASRNADAQASPIGAFLAQCPVPVDFVWTA